MADVLGKKISELAETTDLAGLYTIGSDKNNQSKKVSLQFVKEASDYANAQGDYAKTVGDTVQGNTGVDEYPVFSASKQYAAGDVVLYDGRLYRFTALHAAGAWVGTDVVETSIKAEADQSLAKLESDTLFFCRLDNLKKGYITTSDGFFEEESNLYKPTYIAVAENVSVYVNNPKGYQLSLRFYDKDKTYIGGNWFQSITNFDIPSSAAYMRVSLRQEGLSIDNYVPVTFIQVKRTCIVQSSNTPANIDLAQGTITLSNTNIKYGGKEYVVDGAYSFSSASSSNKIMVFNIITKSIEIINGVSFNDLTHCLIGSIVFANKTLYSANLPFAYNINGFSDAQILQGGCEPFVIDCASVFNGYIGTNGVVYRTEADTTICTEFFLPVIEKTYYELKCNIDYLATFYFYRNDKTFISYNGWFLRDRIVYTPKDCCYLRICLRDVSGLNKDNINPCILTRYTNECPSLWKNTLFPNKWIDHLFMEKASQYAYENNLQNIPAESLEHIAISKRLGFKVIEASINKTSDNQYVVLHGTQGKFGYQVVDLQGKASYANTAINSVTMEWIKNNVRYHSTNPRFRVAPPSLEEWLWECKRQDMIPFVKVDTKDLEDTLLGIMGEGNFMSWNGNHSRIKAPIQISDIGSSNIEAILAACNKVGKPCIYGMSTTSYSDEEISSIVAALHSEGYFVGWSANYSSEAENQRCIRLGLDWATSGWNLPCVYGNIYHQTSDEGYDSFTHNGELENGLLHLNVGNQLSLTENLKTLYLSGAELELRFKGTLRIAMGEYINDVIVSDGNASTIISTFFLQRKPTFQIIAESDSDITYLSFKVDKK